MAASALHVDHKRHTARVVLVFGVVEALWGWGVARGASRRPMRKRGAETDHRASSVESRRPDRVDAVSLLLQRDNSGP
ncbi:MAG TPA: hypothetical protein VHJ83_11330 [Micromonosporaceae bacterium]|nr:hypothetical protein [Micromonosporaceae bacterium]